MSASTIKIIEGVPAAPRAMPWRLSVEAINIGPEPIWQRVEQWTRHRWGSRSVVYIADGVGDWNPPLSPSTITVTEIWRGDQWEAITLRPSPLGGFTLAGGTYRFTGVVGDAALPPAIVMQAVGRLAEYFALVAGDIDPFLVTHSDGDFSETRAAPTWHAKALQLSGAADLLRKYRDLGAT